MQLWSVTTLIHMLQTNDQRIRLSVSSVYRGKKAFVLISMLGSTRCLVEGVVGVLKSSVGMGLCL